MLLNHGISEIERRAFAHYNLSLSKLSNVTDGTMGHNDAIEKVHPLRNLLEESDPLPIPLQKEGVEIDGFGFPTIGKVVGLKSAICDGINKDRQNNVQNRVYGIIFPLCRKGNEKMTLLHADIWSNNVCLTPLMVNHLSNVQAIRDKKQSYFKALLMRPLWQLITEYWDQQGMRNILLSLMDISPELLGSNELDFNNKDFCLKINENRSSFLKLDGNSSVLVPQTRSEDESFGEFLPWFQAKLSELVEDYEGIDTISEGL
jgi:hypothetical protein